jgi:anti-anti-sigma regulatory factor
MEINIQKSDNYTLIHILEKQIYTGNSPHLKSEFVLISAGGENNIILDISACENCDSSGLSAILTANRLCRNAGGILVVAGLGYVPILRGDINCL